MPSKTPKKYEVAIADDHRLVAESLSHLINEIPGFEVTLVAANGQVLLDGLAKQTNPPDIIILDINMPVMNGVQAAKELSARFPLIRLLALSMNDDETSVIQMIRSGCRGYLLKDCTQSELHRALTEILERGFYYSDYVTGKLIHTIHKEEKQPLPSVKLSEREMEFIKHAASELTYKEIAISMGLSERTIDGYREALFEKLQVKSRVGLVLYAIRLGWVKADPHQPMP
ncbi:response regulator transcription factor [Flavihumibacter petaseus]|uniref:Putative two-component response regulator n=1 Tax=Flavihumibacter petaseus NBRC 106054 TaxID=1220578 RepID=A0A0E9MZB0_9BACT|nr:response regulator transcription factor [Flavihumibacter petaseus]GAO42949.1 putative two-component response regulator [Flavihumibacter petaseus NBRC 106054]